MLIAMNYFLVAVVVSLFHSITSIEVSQNQHRIVQGFGVLGNASDGGDSVDNFGIGSSPSVKESSSPSAAPTIFSGVVILPQTIVPTVAPTANSTLKSESDWVSIAFSYTSQFYTINSNQLRIAVTTVTDEITNSLRRLVKQLNVSVTVQFLSTEVLGVCHNNTNTTITKDLQFPNFPVCTVVKTEINTKIDGNKIEPNVVHDSFVEHIRNAFISAYNKNSTVARLVYLAPIEVSAVVSISMVGVETSMNVEESNFFIATVRTGVMGILLNGTEAKNVGMNLEEVKILHQVSSTGKRLLQSESNNVPAGGKFNNVEVLITTSCAKDNNCTNESLEVFLNEFAPNYGLTLMAALIADANFFYFDDLVNLSIGQQTDTKLPTPQVQPAGTEEIDQSDKMPLWLVAIIVANCAIVCSILLYVCVRLSVRYKQGGKLKDTPKEETTNHQRLSFVPAPAPTFQQLQDLNGRESSNDTPIFSKWGQSKAPPVQEYEDDEYDNKSCDDQFSVEAGSFGGDGYETNQWHSSYNSYA